MASLLKKNYASERLPDINLNNPLSRDAGAVLGLNGTGRRYLIEGGSYISKGVEVLSRVNNDINCVFWHLSENPRLCDRSAVEMVSSKTTACPEIRLIVVVEKGNKPAHTKVRSPAGDSRSFDSLALALPSL
jgi:hypothetical protein